jgi:gentisate 1,2-dioxygenase
MAAIRFVIEGDGGYTVVPTWCWQQHQADPSADAILFQANDEPGLRSLALFRDQTAPASAG